MQREIAEIKFAEFDQITGIFVARSVIERVFDLNGEQDLLDKLDYPEVYRRSVKEGMKLTNAITYDDGVGIAGDEYGINMEIKPVDNGWRVLICDDSHLNYVPPWANDLEREAYMDLADCFYPSGPFEDNFILAEIAILRGKNQDEGALVNTGELGWWRKLPTVDYSGKKYEVWGRMAGQEWSTNCDSD